MNDALILRRHATRARWDGGTAATVGEIRQGHRSRSIDLATYLGYFPLLFEADGARMVRSLALLRSCKPPVT